MSWEKKIGLQRSVSKRKPLNLGCTYPSAVAAKSTAKSQNLPLPASGLSNKWPILATAPVCVFSETALNRNTTREMEFALGLSSYCDF